MASRLRSNATPWVGSILLLTGVGCSIVDAKVSNLRELHEPDGTPRRVGVVYSDSEYVMRQLLRTLRFGGEVQEGQPERIDDPLGTCLDNLLELSDFSEQDERVLGLQAELFSWLAVDCSYMLSRERAVLGLARVGRRLGIEDPSRPLSQERATRPEKALEWLRDLRAAVEPYLQERVDAPAAQTVSDAIGAIDVTVLDRDGARRLLRALNVWYETPRFDTAPLESFGELRLELARRSVELALAEALSDPDGRVRAAALEACIEMSGNRLPRLLRAALGDPDAEVVTRALDLLASYGVPEGVEPEFDGDRAAYTAAWADLVVRLLRLTLDGPVSVSACRAMEKISGAGFSDLRPETWVGWWDGREAREALGPVPAGASGGSVSG